MNENIKIGGSLGKFLSSVRQHKRIQNSHYLISDDGRLYSLKQDGRELKPSSDRDGYKVIGLRIDGKAKQYKVHRLVMKHFSDNEEKQTVNHINGIKSDNRIENLEWCTHTENIQHAVKTGLINFESRRKIKPFKPIIVKEGKVERIVEPKTIPAKKAHIPEILKLYSEGMSVYELACKFGIRGSSVTNIISKKSWRVRRTKSYSFVTKACSGADAS